MKLSTFAIIVTILAVGFGLAFLLIPEKLADYYGTTVCSGGIVMARYFGASNLLIGVIYWSYSSVSPAAKSWPKLLLYSLFYDIIQLVITAMAVLNKDANPKSWSSVALFGVLAVASLYYMGVCRKARAQGK